MPDPTLTPVDHDPFAPMLTPVEHDPFGSPPTANVAGDVASIAQKFGQRAIDWYNKQPSWSDQMHEAMASGDRDRQISLLGGFVGQTTPGRFQSALTGSKLAEATAPNKILFYHASPHNFDKFDVSKIGTGEGAQAYGHGLYVAENRQVAEEYHRDFRRFRGQSKMYQGTINADPDHFLHWDKPLDEQSPHVQKAIDDLDIPKEVYPKGETLGQDVHDALNDFHADQVFDDLKVEFPHELGTRRFKRALENEVSKRTTQSLQDAGIVGIKYLDRDSRNVYEQMQKVQKRLNDIQSNLDAGHTTTPSGNDYPSLKVKAETSLNQLKSMPLTHNYVVFRDDIMDIVRKYGIAGLIAGNAAHFSMTPVDEDPFNAPSSAH